MATQQGSRDRTIQTPFNTNEMFHFLFTSLKEIRNGTYPTNQQLQSIMNVLKSPELNALSPKFSRAGRTFWADLGKYIDAWQDILRNKNKNDLLQHMMYHFDTSIKENGPVIEANPDMRDDVFMLVFHILTSQTTRDCIHDFNSIIQNMFEGFETDLSPEDILSKDQSNTNQKNTYSKGLIKSLDPHSNRSSVDTHHELPRKSVDYKSIGRRTRFEDQKGQYDQKKDSNEKNKIAKPNIDEKVGHVGDIVIDTEAYPVDDLSDQDFSTLHTLRNGKEKVGEKISEMIVRESTPKPGDRKVLDDENFVGADAIERLDKSYGVDDREYERSQLYEGSFVQGNSQEIAVKIIELISLIKTHKFLPTTLDSMMICLKAQIQQSKDTNQPPNRPYVDQAWNEFKIFISNVCNGFDFKPLDQALVNLYESIPTDHTFTELLTMWAEYLTKLQDVNYLHSEQALFRGSNLIEQTQTHLKAHQMETIAILIRKVDELCAKLLSDPDSKRLVKIAEDLSLDLTKGINRAIVKDILMVLVPNFISHMGLIKVPMIEYKGQNLKMQLQPFSLQSSLFFPSTSISRVLHEFYLPSTLEDSMLEKSITIEMREITPSIIGIPFFIRSSRFFGFKCHGTFDLQFVGKGMTMYISFVQRNAKMYPQVNIDLQQPKITFYQTNHNFLFKISKKQMEVGIRVGMIAAVRKYVQEKVESLWEQFNLVNTHLVSFEKDEDKLDVMLEAMGFGVDDQEGDAIERQEIKDSNARIKKESVDPSLLPWASHKFDLGVQ